MSTIGTLYFFSGKMGAGKSTKAKEIEQTENAVLLSEDEWLEKLYPKQINNFDDYLNYSKLIKPLLKEHIQHILKVGSNVVLDFPGNTTIQRKWLLSIASEINGNHQLIFLNINDDQCLKRINKRRNEEPAREQFDTEETFEYVSSFFETPKFSEGLNIIEIK
ncbi:AAA family ATPase [Staphylococcus succinus]|uniref:Cell division protein ZipA n=2 Tax=Staphylococcus succinus TaxID=61015 RepID=A0A9Q6MU34_9STAP|nr:ATP-binding protein [Staphylococcus succinus]MBU0437057.1 ATP-binding protein [Staphylococcus succinus]MEB8125993.1 ATP-binding protein [Staphylococcus succinus]PTI46433.1 cell division protein ZipA [Staphylococcus succinus]PTI73804.1 cell division protein ZipA [Staphylococcus succinus]PTJ14295.1 cell division protein ZipA [Staphylococcus succinus]